MSVEFYVYIHHFVTLVWSEGRSLIQFLSRQKNFKVELFSDTVQAKFFQACVVIILSLSLLPSLPPVLSLSHSPSPSSLGVIVTLYMCVCVCVCVCVCAKS